MSFNNGACEGDLDLFELVYSRLKAGSIESYSSRVCSERYRWNDAGRFGIKFNDRVHSEFANMITALFGKR